jgi:hypothetical protein
MVRRLVEKLIAEPIARGDEPSSGSRTVELGPEVPDHRPQQRHVVGAVRRPPDGAEELGVGDDLAGPLEEPPEQAELGRRQVDRSSVDGERSGVQIEAKARALDDR